MIDTHKAIKLIRYVLTGSVILVTGFIAYLVGKRIPYEQQMAIFAGISDTSAILFGVFGAWLAIHYKPDISKRLNGLEGAEALKTANAILVDAQRFRIIFDGILASSCMILLVLFATLAAPVVKGLPWCCLHSTLIRGLSFACLAMAVLFQMYVILAALAPMVEARRVVSTAKDDADFIIKNSK